MTTDIVQPIEDPRESSIFNEAENSYEPHLKKDTEENKISEEQVSFNFEITPQKDSTTDNNKAEHIVYNLDDEVPAKKEKEPAPEQKPKQEVPQDEDQLRRSQERILRLRALSMKMKTPSGITELENEPAYKRREIKLEDVPHSSESQISRYTLSESEDEANKKTELKDNNSFLHDNVD